MHDYWGEVSAGKTTKAVESSITPQAATDYRNAPNFFLFHCESISLPCCHWHSEVAGGNEKILEHQLS